MTTSGNSEHTKTNSKVEHETILTGSRKYFWQHKHFFHHVLVNITLIFIAFGLVFAWIPFFGPQIEKYLFPSTRHIEVLEREYGVLSSKLEQLQHTITDIKGQLSELSSLKQQVGTLSETINTHSNIINELNEKIARIKQASTESHLLQEPWEIIQTRYQKGEAFAEVLHTLIPKLGTDKQLLETLHQLTVPANTSSKPISVLTQELQTIYDELKKSKETGSSLALGETWWQRLLQKIYALIHITHLNEGVTTPKYDNEGLQILMTSLENALKQLNSQQLPAALDIIRPIENKHKALLAGWLQDAEKRKSLEDAFNLFKIRFEAFISRS